MNFRRGRCSCARRETTEVVLVSDGEWIAEALDHCRCVPYITLTRVHRSSLQFLVILSLRSVWVIHHVTQFQQLLEELGVQRTSAGTTLSCTKLIKQISESTLRLGELSEGPLHSIVLSAVLTARGMKDLAIAMTPLLRSVALGCENLMLISKASNHVKYLKRGECNNF